MLQDWLIEIAKGIGKLFLNPLLYWSVIFIILIGIRRIKQERRYFGTKVFDVLSEWKDTWGFSVIIGIFYSIVIIGIGMVISYEAIIILSIVTILLTLTFRFTMLSPSYTIGITIIILLLSPSLSEYLPIHGEINLSTLAILLALFLFVEAHFLSRIRQNETFPALVLGERGSWIGRHWIKKFSIIPLFTLVPSGLIEPFAAYWPFLSIGGDDYALVLIPFVLGFEFPVRGSMPYKVANRLAMKLLGLAVIVLAIAIGSIFISWLTIVAVVVAIFGREFINYRFRTEDHARRPFFNHTHDGLKVLSVIPGSPADRLNILIGEIITKVNGHKIHSEEELYVALQQTGSFFKVELFDNNGEIRFVQSAMYEGDHHELGLIFTSEPYRKIK
ncbi:PDZ domain-containing protein [Paucisalibacillus sp. EB02]|uniref:PDZ domain-containing protein n=1 Tax=Paucisalibacillus sp. EB02 TaxID=1347087 RepID=UPI0004B6CA7F|nr:PDZ domain-containing protein [Paucisalibacillus sp. EB02]